VASVERGVSDVVIDELTGHVWSDIESNLAFMQEHRNRMMAILRAGAETRVSSPPHRKARRDERA
jgi:hypothetical protein